jgi:hypothetical protein
MILLHAHHGNGKARSWFLCLRRITRDDPRDVVPPAPWKSGGVAIENVDATSRAGPRGTAHDLVSEGRLAFLASVVEQREAGRALALQNAAALSRALKMRVHRRRAASADHHSVVAALTLFPQQFRQRRRVFVPPAS